MVSNIELAKHFHELGADAKKRGDLPAAHANFYEAVRLNPDECAHHNNVSFTAFSLFQQAQPYRDQAYFHSRFAAQNWPDKEENWAYYAEICLALDKFQEAIPAFEKAISLNPNKPGYQLRIGFAYAKTLRPEKAAEFYKKALEINPEIGDIHALLSTYYSQDAFDPEKQAYHGEKAFTCKQPSVGLSVEAKWNAAHGFLGIGCYEKGWTYFEARHQENSMNRGYLRPTQRYKKPMWYGERDCTVCVSAEMGLGDQFLFVRYLIFAEKKFGIKIIFECHPQMLNLITHNFPSVRCVLYGSVLEDEFDFHLPMMSFPFAMKEFIPFWDGATL